MKNIHIENSYNVWNIQKMKKILTLESYRQYKNCYAENVLSRTYKSLYVEWWLHNIGYYITLPFIKNEKINNLNQRFKHVDLEEL